MARCDEEMDVGEWTLDDVVDSDEDVTDVERIGFEFDLGM